MARRKYYRGYNKNPGETCPICQHGTLLERQGKYGNFLGCSTYPRCDFTQRWTGKVGTPEQEGQQEELLDNNDSTLDAMVRRIAQETVDIALDGFDPSSAQSRTVAITFPELPTVHIDTAHSALETVLQRIRIRSNILLVGPAGSGKTTLGEQVAKALNRPFATLSCSPGLPDSSLIGRMVPNITSGTEHYRIPPFVPLYEFGGVFLLDEADNADASTLLILNSALANGHITTPDGTLRERHKDFVLIASANTYGHGADRMYVGRGQLDAAFLDRFVGATVSMDYDKGLETALCPDVHIRNKLWDMRDKARAMKLRRVLSTRALLAMRDLSVLGTPMSDILAAITEGWTPEDRQAVGAV